MRALGLIVLGGLAWGCTSSEPSIEVDPQPVEDSVGAPAANPIVAPIFIEQQPGPLGPGRELGPLLGGRVVERVPTPGRWSASVQFHQHRYITVEHMVESNVGGTAVLRLGDDGLARACFFTDESSSSDISHYQASDGKDHHSESAHAVVVGMTGTWKLDGEGPEVLVQFDRMEWRTCEVDPNEEAFARPPLRCFGFAANAKVPGDAMLCSVPKEMNWIATLSLLIGDSTRAGAWEHRHDPSGEPTPEDAGAWLLLGSDPGFELRARDTDRDAEPLTIRAEKVEDPVAMPAEP